VGGTATAEEIHNSGKTRASDERAAALIRDLGIEVVQEINTLFQSIGELAVRAAESMQAELTETHISIASSVTSQLEAVQRVLADFGQKAVEALPPSTPVVGAAYDGWEALSKVMPSPWTAS